MTAPKARFICSVDYLIVMPSSALCAVLSPSLPATWVTLDTQGRIAKQETSDESDSPCSSLRTRSHGRLSSAQTSTVAMKRFGMPVPSSAIDRVIDITVNTRWINVMQNEGVRIRNGDRSFDWQFSTRTTSSFDLAQIAPPNFDASPTLRVYVAPDTLYKRS